MDTEVDRAALSRWLEVWLPIPSSIVAAYHSLDLREFIEVTSEFGGGPGERLRLLAIYLEEERGVGMLDPVDWPVLRRVYDAATDADPTDVVILKSRALAALRYVEAAVADGRAEEPWCDALDAAEAAVRMDGGDPEVWRLLGDVKYWGDDSLRTEALEAYERAIALDPHEGWTQLYRAHALHDLARWDEAADAYAQLDSSNFPGAIAWRIFLAREQRAHCLLRAGRRVEALVEFEAALSAREEALDGPEPVEDAPALQQAPQLIVDAVEELPEIADRVSRLLRRDPLGRF